MSGLFHLREMPKLPLNKNFDLENDGLFRLEAEILAERIKRDQLVEERGRLIDRLFGRE